MNLYPVTYNYTNNIQNKRHQEQPQGKIYQNQVVTQTDLSLIPHYKIIGINFTGRTPEDFYAQDFNRDNMPSTMKDYLDSDYEKWQHVPPEQLMQKAFEYLEIADNFDDVKDLYPNEPLFNNLKDGARVISSIAYEIKTAKELSNEPVLKSGEDNFGMYLLRKIYLEGKTIKEIDNDFYQKDMNPVYKGVISKPITSDVFRLYGIRYPEKPFWNSFIATRDEYKKFFVTLPKNEKLESMKNSKSSEKTSSLDSPKKAPQPRKYRIKEYKLEQFAKEVKDAKGDLKQLEIRIKRRFGKDDPEASFFLKYMSPIMTLVSERIHLSESMRDFHDLEVANGKMGDEDTKLARFWKNNPVVLENLSKTIPSTIEIFEEAYGVGGDIPINKNLEIIIPEMIDNVAIDNVSSEFVELLEYTQNIETNRLRRYAKHDQLQAEWEKYFIEKYGEVQESEEEKLIDTKAVDKSQNIDDVQDDPKVFTNLEDALRARVYLYPKRLADKYIKDFMNNPNISEEYKNDILSQRYAHIDYEKECVTDDIDYNNDYFTKNRMELGALCFALSDLTHKYMSGDNVYSREVHNYLPALNKNCLDWNSGRFVEFIDSHRNELNQLYGIYMRPTNYRDTKVLNYISEKIQDLSVTTCSVNSEHEQDIVEFSDVIAKSIRSNKFRRKALKESMFTVLSSDPLWARLLNNIDYGSEKMENIKLRRFMGGYINSVLLRYPTIFCSIVDKSILDSSIEHFSSTMRQNISSTLAQATPEELTIFKSTNEKFNDPNNKYSLTIKK